MNLFIGVQAPEDGSAAPESLSKQEQYGLGRYQNFGDLGNAYAREHGTRPATVGLVLSSSPIALLAWYGPGSFLAMLTISGSVRNINNGLTQILQSMRFSTVLRCIGSQNHFLVPSTHTDNFSGRSQHSSITIRLYTSINQWVIAISQKSLLQFLELGLQPLGICNGSKHIMREDILLHWKDLNCLLRTLKSSSKLFGRSERMTLSGLMAFEVEMMLVRYQCMIEACQSDFDHRADN